jgi:ketosteroid isomerase-like protein
MDNKAVVQALWDRTQARDWSGVRDLLADDLVVDWPVTAERITGRANYLAVNTEYPEGWTIHVLQIVADGDSVVSEVAVDHTGSGAFRAASFWTVRGGVITAGREYWTAPGSEGAPEWRAPYVSRLPWVSQL